MTNDETNSLLDYHYWARDRMLAALDSLSPEQFAEPMESSFKSIRDTVVHIMGAEMVWYSRWRGSPQGMPRSDSFGDVAALRSAWRELESAVRVFFQELGAERLETRLEYRSLKGELHLSSFEQMLRHVVNHASYHRGQVTTMLRQVGAKPPESTDLINYYRTLEKTQGAATPGGVA
ncbi:MAG: damage-inducible protein DinB [Acidobacteria bacterium]|nr:MAG: damage-inducible protein DinB [Acidobacteriota bacterium]